jgi:C1A family cysteine protease
MNIANLTKLFNLLNPINYQNADASKINQLSSASIDTVKNAAINVISSNPATATLPTPKSPSPATPTSTTSNNLVPISPPSSTQINVGPLQGSGLFGSTSRNLATLPDVDWSNVTGPVRFQGNCGACYAFASINVL